MKQFLFFEKAEQYFTNPDLLYNMGIAYLLLNKGSLAIPFFKKALEHNDEDGESYIF
ncbi:MAG: tetratricopeptide repeat protein [Bacillaceae bacterium]|nr:tetratricopeptide repeat protein [Bacillaceae bacterium]